MAQRYRNARREEELNEDLSNNPEQEGGDPQSPSNTDTPTNGEDEGEGNWKKRHGDLRRAASRKEQELKDQIEQLKQGQGQGSPKFPADEKEFMEWVGKYPQMTKMVDTLVQRRILEGNAMLDPKFNRVSELEKQIAEERAERTRELALNKILKTHPDFNQLVADDKFQKWIESSSKLIQDALWENDDDPDAAIDAVDLYKSRNKTPTRNKDREVDTASTTRRGSSSPSPTGGSEPLYSESQVRDMDDRWYEKHEDKIREAIRDGRFNYDLSS